MAAAALTPGHATDRKRQIEVQALAVKLEGLRHLSLAVRRNDAGELAAYNAAQAESARLLATVPSSR